MVLGGICSSVSQEWKRVTLVWDRVWKLSGLREPRGEDATHFLLNCQGTQRWREKILGKKGLQVNDAVVASKKLVWQSLQSCKTAASRHIL
jgi:hypothetical protein